jgi:predicted amidohydrolase
VIANWPEKRRAAWSTLLAARAIENQCFVLGVNRVGLAGPAPDRLEPHSGDSALLDPFGEARATVRSDAAVLLGAVDPAEVAQIRARFPFLKDRRPDLYAKLVSGGAEPE